MLIGLIGKKKSGKDTFADYIINKYNFHKLTFADPLKEICKYLFFLNNDQLYNQEIKEIKIEKWNLSPREIFQKVGTDLFRNNFDLDFWTKQFEIRYGEIIKNNPNVICSDVRFQNEADLIKSLGGVLIYIDRQTDNNDNHESEKINIKNYDYYIENNDSKENFYKKINDIYVNIII